MVNSIYTTQGNNMGLTTNIYWLNTPNRQYSDSLTLNPFFNTNSFYNAINYTPPNTNIFDNFQTQPQQIKSRKTTRKIRNNKSTKPQRQILTQPKQVQTQVKVQAQAQPQVQPSRWKRICNWFGNKYEQFNNFIEQPFTTIKNWFTGTPKPNEKISLGSAATQSIGNIALKVISMPILAPLAVAGLMYTSIKPMIQYCKQV